MNKLWKALGAAQGNITKLENKVLSVLQPPRIQERVLPFFETGAMTFSLGDNTSKVLTLVQSANRLTKITGLSYTVEFVIESGGEDFVFPTVDTAYGAANLRNNTELMLMDFIWNFEMGSTERSYANGRVDNEERGLSRSSLGFVDNQNNMLFSEKSPLMLATNEFLKLKVQPTLFAASTAFTNVRCIVNLEATGWRTFSDS